MRFDPVEIKDKLGRTVILRNAEVSDSENLIQYMKATAAETPFLIREPDELCLTLEQEEAFINGRIHHERELMLIATINGEHIGNCSLMSVGTFRRYHHRCEVAIALYQKYCGIGIGKAMMETGYNCTKRKEYDD